jgi:hypothetical protein
MTEPTHEEKMMNRFFWLSFFETPTAINPATGLPMVHGAGGVDMAGNPFGMDLQANDRHEDRFDHTRSTWNDRLDHGSSFDHGSIGNGFNSFGGGFGNHWD